MNKNNIPPENRQKRVDPQRANAYRGAGAVKKNLDSKKNNGALLVKRKRRGMDDLHFLLCLFAICVIIIMLVAAVKNHNIPNNSLNINNEAQTDDSQIIESDVIGAIMTSASTPTLPTGYSYIDVDSDEIYNGNLVLVNFAFPMKAPDSVKTISLYGNKTSNYKISASNLCVAETMLPSLNEMFGAMRLDTGFKDVIVVSAYRTEADQTEIWDDRVRTAGETAAALYVAKPGYSEHHTGFAVDLNVYTDSGKSGTLDKFPDCEWLTKNAHKYGFILRYPAEKTDLTGIAYEQWHFRWVGLPHAAAIYERNLCLEEYILLLKKYTFEGEHLVVEDGGDGKSYEIFYVPADLDSGVTKVPIPEKYDYLISGNNCDGFVVAVRK